MPVEILLFGQGSESVKIQLKNSSSELSDYISFSMSMHTKWKPGIYSILYSCMSLKCHD